VLRHSVPVGQSQTSEPETEHIGTFGLRPGI
jgi:hypothetical protein